MCRVPPDRRGGREDRARAFSSGTAMIIVRMAIVGEAVFKTGGADTISHVRSKFADNERKLLFVTVIFSGPMSGFLAGAGAAGLLIALNPGISLSTSMKRSQLMDPVIAGCRFGGGITPAGTTTGPFLKETCGQTQQRNELSVLRAGPLPLLLLVIPAVYLSAVGYKPLFG